MSLSTGHQSFWSKNGIGCKTVTANATDGATEASKIEGCILDFEVSICTLTPKPHIQGHVDYAPSCDHDNMLS